MNNDVREYRESEGLSQGELADAVDVSRQTINAIERNRYDPSLELAFKLANHFDCTIEELFDPRLTDETWCPRGRERDETKWGVPATNHVTNG